LALERRRADVTAAAPAALVARKARRVTLLFALKPRTPTEARSKAGREAGAAACRA